MEKHDGVAANAGHGALTVMIVYIPDYRLTSLMIGCFQEYRTNARSVKVEEQNRKEMEVAVVEKRADRAVCVVWGAIGSLQSLNNGHQRAACTWASGDLHRRCWTRYDEC
jgi:hypothetical protein